MADNTEYGTTWWGRRWLDSLTGIDFENRIPRGLNYAKEDKVYSLSVDPSRHLVKARVRGNYDPFYAVKITVPAFTDSQKETLISAIADSPVILAQLSARELAPEIDELARSCGISIFPTCWQDMAAGCSCPDDALPCKHIAAVIYRFSQEIDTNPFILFELKGLDIVAELAKRDVNIEQVEQSEMPAWSELLAQSGGPEGGVSLEDLWKATYRDIPDMLDSVTGLFKPSPAGFVHGELRDVMRRCLESAARLAERQLKDKTDRDLPTYSADKPLLSFDSWGRARLNPDFSWTIHNPDRVTVKPFDLSRGSFDGAAYFEMFSGAVDQKKLEISSPEIEALYSAWIIAAKLVKSGAVIPQIYKPIEDFFAVRWIPAVMKAEVRAVTEEVGAVFRSLGNDVVRVERRPENLSAFALGEMILGFFLGSYMVSAFRDLKDWDFSSLPLEYSSMFLASFVDEEEHLGGQSVRVGLEGWMAPIYLQNLNVLPVIILEDRSFDGLSTVVDECRTVKVDEGPVFAYGDEATGTTFQVQPAMGEAPADAGATEEEAGVQTAPVVDDDYLPVAGESGGLFDNAAGVMISMGFNRLDQRGTPEDTFIPLSEIIANPDYRAIRFECLRTVARLSSVCPKLKELLESRGGEGIIALDDLAGVILSAIPAMRILGVRLIIPKTLSRVLNPKISMTVDVGEGWNESDGYLGVADLLDFDWTVALGNHPITAEEFELLRRHEGKVVRFGQSFVYVDPNLTSRIAKKLQLGKTAPAKQRLMAAALTGRFGQDNVQITRRLKEVLDRLLSEKSIELPPTVNATLRPYQMRGYSWLTRNLRTMMGSVIADDMGLGKTLQVISAIEKLRYDGELENKQVLVVVPSSLLINWGREIARFAPKLQVNTYYQIRDLSMPAHVVITTYGVLRSELKKFQKLALRLMVIDEAQNIKNIKSQAFRAVRSIKADSMIAMSGTPVENRLLEYWSIMDFVNPGLLGTPQTFKQEFANPIEKSRDMEAVSCFRRVTAPFIMRRLKSDRSVISDLPDRITTDKYCTLTPPQVALYQAQVEQSMELMKAAGGSLSARNSVVIALIQKLKQICNAPAQFSKEDRHQEAKYAGKMEVLYELLDDIYESRRKCLIFTQFKVMGELLQNWIEERYGHRPQFINGSVPAKERAMMVDRFQNRRDELSMVLSLKAAGTGLNLTAASVVIHYDLWWNPAVEDQATDRAYRIGQKNNVQVYRLICANTFEEKINEIISSKKELQDMAVNAGESWIGDLSNRQIEEIFSISTREAEARAEESRAASRNADAVMV